MSVLVLLSLPIYRCHSRFRNTPGRLPAKFTIEISRRNFLSERTLMVSPTAVVTKIEADQGAKQGPAALSLVSHTLCSTATT